jgi:drug/metabolite transporter (DMT)-like permease
MSQLRLRAIIYILIAIIIWAFGAIVIKLTLVEVPPLIFLIYRFAISAVIGLPYLVIHRHQFPKSKKDLIFLFTFGFLSTTLSLVFLFVGLKDTTVLDVSVMGLSESILIAIAAAVILKEHITHKEKIGAAVAILGTILITVEPLLRNHGSEIRFSGNILIIFYLLTDAASIILLKIILKDRINASFLTHISFVIGFITMIPFVLASYNPNQVVSIVKNLSLPYHGGVWYMAVLSGTVAYTLRAIGQRTLKVEQTVLLGYLGVVFAVPMAIIFLHESFTPFFVVGGAIVVVGIVIAEFRKKRYN